MYKTHESRAVQRSELHPDDLDFEKHKTDESNLEMRIPLQRQPPRAFSGNMMKLPRNLLQCWNVTHPISVCVCVCVGGR